MGFGASTSVGNTKPARISGTLRRSECGRMGSCRPRTDGDRFPSPSTDRVPDGDSDNALGGAANVTGVTGWLVVRESSSSFINILVFWLVGGFVKCSNSIERIGSLTISSCNASVGVDVTVRGFVNRRDVNKSSGLIGNSVCGLTQRWLYLPRNAYGFGASKVLRSA